MMTLMPRLPTVFVLTLILFFLCWNVIHSMNIEGQLVYTGGGNSLKTIALDASEYKTSLLYKDSENTTAISHLTVVNKTTLLFDECSGKPSCEIRQLDLLTKELKSLRKGQLPSYIEDHKKLFFYNQASDGVSWLFVTSLVDLNSITKIAREPNKKTLPNGIKQSRTTPVIQVSRDEIVFVNEEAQLGLYNIANSKLISLGVKNCRPILWRKKSQQLLCKDWSTWTPFLLDIHTKKETKLLELKKTYGLVYIADVDSLVYGRTRSLFPAGEAYDIFLYSFTEKKEHPIKKNSHIAGGVWIRN